MWAPTGDDEDITEDATNQVEPAINVILSEATARTPPTCRHHKGADEHRQGSSQRRRPPETEYICVPGANLQKQDRYLLLIMLPYGEISSDLYCDQKKSDNTNPWLKVLIIMFLDVVCVTDDKTTFGQP